MGLFDKLKAKFNFGMGVAFEMGKGTAPDFGEAVKFYTKAAEAGYTDAQHNRRMVCQSGEARARRCAA